jgi:hypothetical protein
MTCPHEHDAGPYVLGALSPQERVAFERHLADCDGCTRAVRELAGLPGLLARIPVEVVDPDALPEPVPDTLLPGAVRRARRSQRRRGWVAGGLVAAAAVVALGAVGVATLGGDSVDAPPSAAPVAPTTAAPVELRQVGTSSVSGWVSLTSVGWGTRVDLTCEYRNPAVGGYQQDDAPPTYTMVVRKTDGSSEQVASWTGLPGKKLHLAAATAAQRDDITDVEIRSGDGTPVLELSQS